MIVRLSLFPARQEGVSKMIWFINRIKSFHFLFAGLILVFSIPANASDETNSRNILSSSKINTIIVDNYYPYTFINKNGDPDGF